MADAGKIGFAIKGDFDSETQYERLDVVYYQNISYVAKTNTIHNLPTDNTFWQVLYDFNLNVDNTLSTESQNPIANNIVTNELNKKVDKIDGKGLSSNDYTDDEKAKLSSLKQFVQGDNIVFTENEDGTTTISSSGGGGSGTGTVNAYSEKIIGDDNTDTFTITHNLNSTEIIVSLYDSDNDMIITDVKIIDKNTISVLFPEPVKQTESYTVVVI